MVVRTIEFNSKYLIITSVNTLYKILYCLVDTRELMLLIKDLKALYQLVLKNTMKGSNII